MIILILILAAVLGFEYYKNGGLPSWLSNSISEITGQNLTSSEISVYASNAGFSGEALSIAVAIALAESSGNPNAYNPETEAGAPQGMGSYGLWQIYLNQHPEFQGQNLYDPQTNANDAFSIYQRAGFQSWATYNSGAYQEYLA